MKVPLAGLGWDLIEAAGPGVRLTADIASRGHDGTPACATVPLLTPGWRPKRA